MNLVWSLTIAQRSAGHKVHVTSPLRMGNSLGREESGIIILGNLGKVCLNSKRWLRSASTEQKGHQVVKMHSQLSEWNAGS